MSKITRIRAREIIDSRGQPTVEAEVLLDSGFVGRAAVPSGASTGEREALELRDGDKKRFLGKGVRNAVRNIVEKIGPRLRGKDPTDQAGIDRLMIEMDGTEPKSALGANSILAVSMAVARAAAGKRPLHASLGPGRILPCPFMNVINGGAHADNTLDYQEFMIVPGGLPTFADALRAGCEVFHTLKGLLKARGYSTSVGDEGGFAPKLKSHSEALDLLLEAIEKAGYRPGRQVALALDVAASELYSDGGYEFKKSGAPRADSGGLIALYEELCGKYPIVSIEDGLSENDRAGWAAMTRQMGVRVQIVGDDLFVTNPNLLRQGIRDGLANSILIKLNQVGTVTETVEAIAIARKAGYGAMISHRSGETEDTTIAHLAVAFDTGMIKTGSVSRTDRTAKYNELLRIEESLGARAVYAGFGSISRSSAGGPKRTAAGRAGKGRK
jgi:enolase